MKGVILAGGRATRLYPLTLVTNKHLLPVYNKPVIYYAIEKMISAGIDRIMIVTSPRHIDNFVQLLGSGQDFKSTLHRGSQIQIVYGIQNKPGGLAEGLLIAKDYVGSDSCMLYLGDNIFEDDIRSEVKKFKDGAVIFLKEVANPSQFGIAVVKNGVVKSVEEKPRKPKSKLAVTGMYLYDQTVWSRLPSHKSARGEYEITDVNNSYIKDRKMKAVRLVKPWFDMGTIDDLLEASKYMSNKSSKQ